MHRFGKVFFYFLKKIHISRCLEEALRLYWPSLPYMRRLLSLRFVEDDDLWCADS